MSKRKLSSSPAYKICRKIFQESFYNAAQSLGSFINRNVDFEFDDLIITDNEDIRVNKIKKQSELLVFTTELIGDVNGKSYLILSDEDARRMVNNMSNNTGDQAYLEAILLELDNVLSASVITIISNHIDAKIYGDVPQLHRMRGSALHEFINKDYMNHYNGSNEEIAIVVVKSKFVIDGKNGYSPGFIWKLPVGFLNLLNQKDEV